ncbi:hypothetical protein [Brunnivagina elsteri]|uniref:hypothetical protein n=1 Tax=Brunnivagina elsteri TaxID=1247191 RepID=UPI001177BDDE|nr:hypothetical protein [Calothrix elsteri]
MKVLPARFMLDSLPAHIDQARYLENEAGNRAQSDYCYGWTLVLIGSSHGKTDAYKSNLRRSGTYPLNPTLSELIPAAFSL